MIGIFDSGYGGLTVVRELVKSLPEYSYLYLGDNAREPYGGRDPEEIYRFTLECVEFLFTQGCPLVIMACNTSSANALRRIQQEVLPEKYPNHRVLGVLAPAVEEITGQVWNSEGTDPASGGVNQNDRLTPVDPIKTVGVLGTPATIASGAYTREIKKRNPAINIFEQACPNLADLIASDAGEDEIRADVRSCLDQLAKQMRSAGIKPPPDAILIGCTHYALIKDILADEAKVPLIDQGPVTADRLRTYLERHSEIESQIDKTQARRFLTTDDPAKVSPLASRFYGKPIRFEQAQL